MIKLSMGRALSSASILVLGLAASPAFAQEAPQQTVPPQVIPPQDSGDDFHRNDGIVVTAPYLRDLNILAGTSALSGDDLAIETRGQIGETLLKLPGVSATSFTPGASRPVLRGFQGERIRVLTDGIGSIDASNTSADHAVALEPLTVERIEVLRGPAVLLFGGQAIGGAVNAIDKRIPRAVPDEPVHVDALATYGSAANERSIGGSADAAIADRLVFHVDGSYRKTDDLEVGGFVLSPSLRAEQLAIAAEEAEEGHADEAAEALELAGLKGRVPNTGTRTYSLGGGLAFIDDGGSLGVSVSYFDSLYGVPARPGAGHHHDEEEGAEAAEEEAHGEEAVTIGLKQYRADFRGEVKLQGAFEALRLRAAYADYEHTEFEGDEIGTVFTNQGIEGRVELVQREKRGWRGASGIQYVSRDFAAIGAEAFVPANLTSQIGVFTLQEFRAGDFDFEVSARYDRVETEAKSLGLARNFDSFSGALGIGYVPSTGWKTGINFIRSERAPSAEELFSDGPHIATQAYERGDATFDTERSIGGEIYLRYEGGDHRFAVTGYLNDFKNFIIDLPTGLEEDDLPLFQYSQQDARFWGLEFEGSARLATLGQTDIIVDGVADYVHARLDGIGPVPRIPPLRLLGGLEARTGSVSLRGEVEYFADQNRNAAFETETDGFTLVNAVATWKPFGKDKGVTLIASANNLFDVDGRRAASFTKDFVPVAGRDLRVAVRLSF